MDIAEIFGVQKEAGGSREVIQSTRKVLLDETEHIISSLELNRIAFWTYHEASIADGEDLCELVIELLQSILSKPESHTPLTLQKSLAVLKHILTYGAEVVVNQAICLGRHVETLLKYNTILMAQKKQGFEGFFLQIKGGGVDRGGPVREIATSVHALLSDVSLLQLERSTKADPTSLVPVGNQKAAFVTDEVRLYALKKRMEHEQTMVTKSNLAKADGGFGGGYMSRDGKNHVGAAHGIEEMLKQAEKEQKRFSDDQMANPQRYNYNVDPSAFAEYVAPNPDMISQPASFRPQAAAPVVADLLSMDDPAPQSIEADLLGFGNVNGGSGSSDILGMGSDNFMGAPSSSGPSLWDPIEQSGPDLTPTSVWAAPDHLESLTLSTATANHSATSDNLAVAIHDELSPALPSNALVEKKTPMISYQHDRFSALDDLMAGSTSGNTNLFALTTAAAATSLDSLTAQSISSLSLYGPAMGRTSAATDTSPIVYAATSLKISEHLGGFTAADDDDDAENGYIMGGAAGTGVLGPMAPAPAVPPPPPPPPLGGLF